MTKYEQMNKIDERFIVTYGKHKVFLLREKGIFYLFTGFNTNSHGQFWVYDATPEVRAVLNNYTPERLESEKNR